MTMPNTTTTPSPAGSPGADASDASRTGGARAQIREVKEQVVDQAKDTFRRARDSAAGSLSTSRNETADRIRGIASAFRRTSDSLRSENQNRVANLTDTLAEQVERLSSYLREHDLKDVRDDAENLARRQPAVAIGAALALGMLGARFLKSSQRSHREDQWTGGSYGGA
jgi:methyl-accepting chemotaxis protein